MPAFEARLRDFEAAGAQVVGISCDSIYSHEAWAKALGGISYPLLADIHRDVVKRYGIHWPELNACYRATFVIDGEGIVRYVERYGRGHLPDPLRRSVVRVQVALDEGIGDDRLRAADVRPAPTERIAGDLRHGKEVQRLDLKTSQRA